MEKLNIRINLTEKGKKAQNTDGYVFYNLSPDNIKENNYASELYIREDGEIVIPYSHIENIELLISGKDC